MCESHNLTVITLSFEQFCHWSNLINRDPRVMSQLQRKGTLAIDATLVQDNIPAEVVRKLYIGSLHGKILFKLLSIVDGC